MSSAHVVDATEKLPVFCRSKTGIELPSQRGDHNRGSDGGRLRIHQEFPISHDLLVINPDVELPSDNINVG